MPRFYDFFNIPIRPPHHLATALPPGTPTPTGAGPTGSQGVFITPQSIVTFPVASFVVGLIWKVIGFLYAPLAGNNWLVLVISLLIAFLIWLIAISDPASTATARDKQIGFVIAFINGVYLFGATVGITKVLNV
jgi:hypothetical protein